MITINCIQAMKKPEVIDAVRRDYDYVIVGAGSAGCVLANRLGQDPNVRILLLEAGPANRHWSIDMPSAMGIVVGGDRFNWQYRSEPEPFLNRRRIATRSCGVTAALSQQARSQAWT